MQLSKRLTTAPFLEIVELSHLNLDSHYQLTNPYSFAEEFGFLCFYGGYFIDIPPLIAQNAAMLTYYFDPLIPF